MILEDRILARAFLPLYGEEERKATRQGPFVGIDVSKDRLDVGTLGERQVVKIANTQTGIKELVAGMQELQPELIVVEAAGGYQRAVVDALFWAGLPVAVVNPARVRQFARAVGLLAKTDRLDTQVLAEFGKKMRPKLYESKSEAGKCSFGTAKTAGRDAESGAKQATDYASKLEKLHAEDHCLFEGRKEKPGEANL